ncbi:MAG: hypothetical protein NTY63_06000 [Candidatus Bipolaricaulota bacterium]|nr:hypothetical protein [Candidatus Bipolaricaulota bacterium]
MIDLPAGMYPGGLGPDPAPLERRPDETDSDCRGRMARLEGNWTTHFALLLLVAGLGLLGTDFAMLFVFGPVEGSPNLPLLPISAPILSLAAVIIGVRIVRRLWEPRARSKPFDWPKDRRF